MTAGSEACNCVMVACMSAVTASTAAWSPFAAASEACQSAMTVATSLFSAVLAACKLVTSAMIRSVFCRILLSIPLIE